MSSHGLARVLARSRPKEWYSRFRNRWGRRGTLGNLSHHGSAKTRGKRDHKQQKSAWAHACVPRPRCSERTAKVRSPEAVGSPPPDPPVCDLGAQFLFSCRTPATNADHGTHARHGQRAEVTPADLQLPKHSVFDAACTVARAVRAHLCKNPLAGTLARARAFRGGDGCRHRHTCKAALTRTAGCRSS